MDDFGDLFYIVLMVLAAIVGAVKSGKKKKEAEKRRQAFQEEVNEEVEEQEVESRPVTSFESIFERLEQSILPEEQVEEIEEIEEFEEPEEVTSRFDSTDINQYQSLSSSYAVDHPELQSVSKHFNHEKTSLDGSHLTQDEKDTVEIYALNKTEKSSFNIHELLNSPEDIKKAIILSEIFNRKY